MPALIMVVTAVAIILLVKYGLVRGIENIAAALQWSAKARGQATGFATSVPELVCLIAAGLAGVWEAGLWNIASSNIINAGLMLIAVLWYRQFHELFNRRFIDELGFAAVGIAIPIALMQAGLDESWFLIPALIGCFAVYRVVDRRVNPHEPDEEMEAAVGSLPFGLILTVIALVSVAVVGIFLGDATAEVVHQLGVHPAIAGWILGVVTSLPEMITFFAVYAAAKRAGTLHTLADTQEVLDNLAASNMSNVGIVYPVGLGVYLLGALIAGS